MDEASQAAARVSEVKQAAEEAEAAEKEEEAAEKEEAEKEEAAWCLSRQGGLPNGQVSKQQQRGSFLTPHPTHHRMDRTRPLDNRGTAALEKRVREAAPPSLPSLTHTPTPLAHTHTLSWLTHLSLPSPFPLPSTLALHHTDTHRYSIRRDHQRTFEGNPSWWASMRNHHVSALRCERAARRRERSDAGE